MDTFTASALSPLSGRDFEDFVADYLAAEGYDVRRAERVGDVLADLIAFPKPGAGDNRPTVVEAKHVLVIDADTVQREISRRELILKQLPNARYLLVVSGALTRKAGSLAASANLEVLDGPRLLSTRAPALLNKWSSTLQANVALLNMQVPTQAPAPVAMLQATLPAIPAGPTYATVYQEWVRDVCEVLFVPPLGPVHYEQPDTLRRNRRDVILQNWAAGGFWSQMRSEYHARDVIVDAKNYSDPIKKRPILELAHYLKPYGCGLFGMIFCRRGPGAAGIHAVREEWIGSHRLILVLSDDEVLEMLALKARGDAPEELLRHRVGVFRQSL